MTDLNDKLRADFEAWARKENYSLERDEDGVYLFSDTLAASHAFKAARATPAPQAAPSEEQITKLTAEIAELNRQKENWIKCLDASTAWLWRDGEPPKPWRGEWFVALTFYGGRVVLRALEEDHTYDYTTADGTYMLAKNIKRWAQFPDSEYVPAPAPLTQAADQSAPTDLSKMLREHDDPRLYHEADVLMAKAADEIERYYGGMMAWKKTAEAKDAATPAAPLAQQSVPIGYVANTAHGWQFRTAAPDENSQWVGMWRAVAYISAQQSESVAWAVVSSKGGIHKLAVTRESAERKAATWQKEWPNNGCTVRSLVFGDAAPLPAQQASERKTDALNEALMEACRDLPEGFVVSINVERGAGWVEVKQPDSSTFPIDSEESSLVEDVTLAVELAVERAALAVMGDARKGGGDAPD